MEVKVQELGANLIGNLITATFGIEGEYIDVELFAPIDKHVENIDKYSYKEKLKIVNAVVVSYKGNPSGLQMACNELNQYIVENKLQPITVGYNVTKYIESCNLENAEIDVYVGINPNIL